MIDKLKRFFGIHVHERKLFLVGNICFVKCVTCGDESIPWEPPLIAVAAASDQHAGDVAELVKINEQIRLTLGAKT